MAYYIPFVNFKDDWSLARSIYPDSAIYRVSLKSREEVGWASSPAARIWVDTDADALPNWGKSRQAAIARESRERSRKNEFDAYFGNLAKAESIADPEFWSTPNKGVVESFINEILGPITNMRQTVEWLSVPQLPHRDGVERNEVNRLLAEATQAWKKMVGFRGKLILPAIFTNQRQLNNKTERNKKVSVVTRCFETSGADGLWVVDSSLCDHDGSATSVKRFKGIIKLHEELNERLPPRTITVAGPYWALGLVLWARGLVQYPAIGLGRGFQYFIQGGWTPDKAKARFALPPLRRQAAWFAEMKRWIEGSLRKIPQGDPAHAQFSDVLRRFQALQNRKLGRQQIAQFYKDWLKKFEGIPIEGRALALYQDFSSAYVLGKTLGDIPQPKDEARSASRIAEHFMVTCL